MLIRPKSMATVVVVLVSTPSVRSMSALGALRSSSVRSGRISVSDPTSVVFPAPKPPAIRILIAIGTASGWPPGSEPAKPICHLSQELRIGHSGRDRMMNGDQPALAHVRKQDPD